MKMRSPGLIAGLMVFLLSFSLGANAMMSGPPSEQDSGPGMGPGPDDGQEPGPRWEQESSQKQVEKGLLFRYGMESPSTSIEGEDTGSDIGIRLAGIDFENETHSMFIGIEDEEWSLQQREFEDGMEVSYESRGEWRSDNEPTGESSRINIRFRYTGSEGARTLSYNISVEDPPENGDIRFSLMVDTNDVDRQCCWDGDGGEPNWEGKELTLKDDKGNELTRLKVRRTSRIETEAGNSEVETELQGDVANSSASLEIGVALPEGTRSASISGSLSILDDLAEALKAGMEEAAEFLIDHIYYFAGGAVIAVVVIAGAMMIASSRKIETQGSDLDLDKNRYYRGPQ